MTDEKKNGNWDEEMQWDREYAKKVLKSATLVEKVLPAVRSGRTLEEQLKQIEKEGITPSLSAFRNSVLGGMEIRLDKKTSENFIKIGCAGFGTILILRFYCLLLQELGIDYAFLKKEYCCLAPVLYQVLGRGQDRKPIDELSRKYLKLNEDVARKQGAKAMLYFCPWCVYRAKWLLKDSDLKQLYCLDVLTQPEVWEGKHLTFEKTVGYFAGRRHRVDIYSEDPSVELPWDEYRKILDRIEGMTIVDIPAYDYPDYPNAVWEQVHKYNLKYLIVNHIVEYGGFSRTVSRISPGTKVMFLPELLLEALGKPQRY
jgi:hypothetical protein